ncbi:hypothetical protein CBL_08658 [Carabus blaptoides fortunei]
MSTEHIVPPRLWGNLLSPTPPWIRIGIWHPQPHRTPKCRATPSTNSAILLNDGVSEKRRVKSPPAPAYRHSASEIRARRTRDDPRQPHINSECGSVPRAMYASRDTHGQYEKLR